MGMLSFAPHQSILSFTLNKTKELDNSKNHVSCSSDILGRPLKVSNLYLSFISKLLVSAEFILNFDSFF